MFNFENLYCLSPDVHPTFSRHDLTCLHNIPDLDVAASLLNLIDS